MDIRTDKMYPYPVLADFLDDYKDNGAFYVKMAYSHEGYEHRVEVSASLSDEGLASLIRSGKASFTYHVECHQTGYRKIYQTDKEKTVIPLSNKKVRGKVQVCAFITAKKDLHGWSSSSFNDDYAGMKFDIDTGSVLAVCSNQLNLTVSDKIDDLADAPSIFNIIQNKDEKERTVLVDEGGDKISVILPFNEFLVFKTLNSSSRMQPVLYSMTLVPALVFVLEKIKSMTQDDRDQYESQYSWYRSIKKALKANFNTDLDSQRDLDDLNSVKMAQDLIGVPFDDAVAVLSASDEEGGGE